MRIKVKGREYDVSITAGSQIIFGYWYGDEAGGLIGGPILGMGIPNGTRIEEVLSPMLARMDRAAERSVP